MSDYYSTLGVERNASADEIKRAYRKAAGQHHPDRGGDTTKFQEIEEAYRTLSDPQKRQEYDNPSPFHRNGGHQQGFPGGFHFNFGQGGFNFNDVFGMFNQGYQQRQSMVRMSLWIRLYDVVVGGKRQVSIGGQNGSTLIEIDIPTGINDGDSVKYAGIAPGGQDLVIQFRVHPDPVWTRQDLNLTAEQSVSVWDLILGNDITVTDLAGNQLIVTVPPRTQSKSVFRLRGKGIRDRQGRVGDIIIKINAVIPDNIEPELIDAIKKHQK